MSDETDKLTDKLVLWIERQYNTRLLKLHTLANGWKKVYRAERADGPDWVVRAFPPPGDEGQPVSVTTLVSMLLFLERQAYPAERIIKTADGSSVAQYGDWQVIITTFLSGVRQHWSPASGAFPTASPVATDAPIEYDVEEYGEEAYYALGMALSQLHTLQPDDMLSPAPASMLPQRELTWVSGLLAGIEDRVPPSLQAQYDHLTAAVQHTDRCEDLPITIIHNDPNPDNVILTPKGEVSLIDWETAGLGPAVIDVGILLSNCFSKQQLRIQHTALMAIVDGYCQRRQLTYPELEHLPDAIRFMRLVLLAGYFPGRVEQTMRDDELIYGATYAQWQAQYEASAEIAALARERFERYL